MLGRTGFFSAAMLLFTSVSAQMPESMNLDDGGDHALITSRFDSAEAESVITIKISSGAKVRYWKYEGYGLTVDVRRPRAEILSAKSGKFLFVRTETDGAVCCWTVMVFDVTRLKALGNFLASQGPIEWAQTKDDCVIDASVQPLFDPETEKTPAREFYCFDGARFVKRRSAGP